MELPPDSLHDNEIFFEKSFLGWGAGVQLSGNERFVVWLKNGVLSSVRTEI